MLKNVPYEQLAIGQQASHTKTLQDSDLAMLGVTSGDINPLHFSDEYAQQTPFGQRIGHGIWTIGLISATVALYLPGPGTIYLGQEVRFIAPVLIGDTVTMTVTVREKRDAKRIVLLDCEAVQQQGKQVLTGLSTVIAPKDALSLEEPQLPPVRVG